MSAQAGSRQVGYQWFSKRSLRSSPFFPSRGVLESVCRTAALVISLLKDTALQKKGF